MYLPLVGVGASCWAVSKFNLASMVSKAASKTTKRVLMFSTSPVKAFLLGTGPKTRERVLELVVTTTGMSVVER
ncbi:hypothetical protein G6F56_014044 [Rhizopus delemar]|nr:hypothetical protein G6F56_014044 [Rhizopus delemar]